MRRAAERRGAQDRVTRVDPEFIRELFAQFRPVTVKRMFGGAGLYSEGVMFGLVFDGAIYLKVDETSIPEFEREGSQPFVYTPRQKPGSCRPRFAVILAPPRAALRRSR
jgi:TfoX/Sxy family transcriptional regulator of competence genes